MKAAKNINDVAFLIQARLGSQRCPNKMLRPFANSTLLDIGISKFVESKLIPNNNIYISLYDQELKDIALNYPINIYHRSKESAMSEGDPITEIYEWWNIIPHKYVVMINACCPFLEIETIDNFVQQYLMSEKTGMFAVIEKKNYFWSQNNTLLTPFEEGSLNTKQIEAVKEAAHCLYAGSLQDIGNNVWMGDFSIPNQIELVSVEEKETFDIDYEWQFNLYEKLYRLRGE